MAIQKVTPIQQTIQIIDKMIKDLQLQREELVAALPDEKPKQRGGKIPFKNPITGEVRFVRG